MTQRDSFALRALDTPRSVEKFVNSRSGPRRVLLGEDDPDVRDFLLHELLVDGYDVVACSDGFEMLTFLEQMPYRSRTNDIDVIVCESPIGEVSAISLLETASGLTKLPPVILLIGMKDEETHARAQSLGAAAVLVGPFDLEDLLVALQHVVNPSASDVAATRCFQR